MASYRGGDEKSKKGNKMSKLHLLTPREARNDETAAAVERTNQNEKSLTTWRHDQGKI